MELENFTLMGHSFGGYTAAQYVRTQNPPLKKLYLLSPAGFTYKTEEEIMAHYKTKYKPGKFKMAMVKTALYFIMDKQVTPFSLMKLTGKQRSMNKYYKSKRLKLDEQESSLFSKFYYLVTEKKTSSDKALGTFLYYARYSRHPIIDTIELLAKENRLPDTTIFYGETDWMDRDHTKEVLNKNGYQLDFRVIPDCGHQIVFQNPIGVARMMIEDLGFDFEQYVPKNYVDKESLEILAPQEE